MVKGIAFAPDLSLPLEVASSPIALLAQRGRGKTRAAKRLAEAFHAAGVPPVIFDPAGVWWGLRLDADGHSKGLDLPILGGLHGDHPLAPTGGKVLAEALVRTRRGCVIDVTGFASEGEKARFAAEFAETFYREKMQHRSPVHLFLEEADEWIPQEPGPNEARMLGAFQRIVRLGRNFGIGITMISLRPQGLSKKVLNLSEVVITLGMAGKHERKAMAEWMDDHEVEKDLRTKVLDQLPRLGWNKFTKTDGGALVWAPLLNLFGVHQVSDPTTFDSSATPEVGDEAETAALPPLDLDDLAKAMAATVEEAKANDPRALRAEVARLKAELWKKPGMAAPVVETTVEVRTIPVPRISDIAELREVTMRLQKAQSDARSVLDKQLAEILATLHTLMESSKNALQAPGRIHHPRPLPSPSMMRAMERAGVPESRPPAGGGGLLATDGFKIRGKMRDMLAALKAVHPARMPARRLALYCGMSANSGTWSDYMSALRTQELIDDSSGEIALGDNGLAVTKGVPSVPPTTGQLVQLWLPKLRGKSKGMLTELVAAGEAGLSPEDLAAKLEMSTGSGTWSDYLSLLNTAGLLRKESGRLYASEMLFP